MRIYGFAILLGILTLTGSEAGDVKQDAERERIAAHSSLFVPHDRCVACHSGLRTASGRDISIGFQWRASMMANSARDPYWHAAVRREVLDHPGAQQAIEDKCTTCHMPMGRTLSAHLGGGGELLRYLDSPSGGAYARIAFDGVSCSLCHQITPEKQGESAFDGGYAIDTKDSSPRKIFGPYEIDAGRQRVMRSSSNFTPTAASHLRESEFCASCHTLYTQAPGAPATAEKFPEQMPYREWQQSSYRATQSCQSCHMPLVEEETAISSVLGHARPALRQHTFLGGNAFMIRLLNKHRGELGVVALPQELEAAARDTEEFLGRKTAQLAVEPLASDSSHLEFSLSVRNLSGHKLPTAYPSRRVWLHVTVSDAAGKTVFESGALRPDGSIDGNDNDADATRFEPHYRQILDSAQVQIYEPIMVDRDGRVTTGLLSAGGYIKDNRLLPDGFDKARADGDVAVRGDAFADPDFTGGSDTVRYKVEVGKSAGPFTVSAELQFQTVAYRWARNLSLYDSKETQRFVGYYDAAAGGSAVKLAQATITMGKSN